LTGRGRAGRCCVLDHHAGRSLGHRGGERKTLDQRNLRQPGSSPGHASPENAPLWASL
jgi:hypothetical protein